MHQHSYSSSSSSSCIPFYPSGFTWKMRPDYNSPLVWTDHAKPLHKTSQFAATIILNKLHIQVFQFILIIIRIFYFLACQFLPLLSPELKPMKSLNEHMIHIDRRTSEVETSNFGVGQTITESESRPNSMRCAYLAESENPIRPHHFVGRKTDLI